MEEDSCGGGQLWRRTAVEEDSCGGGQLWRRTAVEEDSHITPGVKHAILF